MITESNSRGLTEITLYVRRFDCAVCGKPVYYDDETGELTCGCCTIKLAVKPLDLAVNFFKLPVNKKVVMDGAKQP